jgi:hypothetical protein
VIIHNFYVRRADSPVRPFEADSPLIVNANAVLALAISGQGLKAITGQRRKIPIEVAASIRSSFIRTERSNPEKALTRFPAAKSRVRLSR